jgi:hypothetical protein
VSEGGAALGDVPADDHPFRASGLANTSSALAKKLAKLFRRPILRGALWQARIAPDLLRAIVDEHFTLFAQHRRLIWLLDRCAGEVAELNAFQRCADDASPISLAGSGFPRLTPVYPKRKWPRALWSR